MSISDIGVDGVLQFDPSYLTDCIDDEIDRVSVSCLDTDGDAIKVGDSVIRTTDVTLSLKSTGFIDRGNRAALEMELTAENGRLEVGSNARSLQETSKATVKVPLSVREDPAEDRVVQLLVETGLPGVHDVGIDVLNYTHLDAHGISFAPDDDVGAVKILPDDTVAIGLLNDAPGGGLSGFRNDYADSELSGSDTWGLVLDQSMIERYVEAMVIGQEQDDDDEGSEENLRNVNLTVDGIDEGNLRLDAEGEAKWAGSWWNFSADVDVSLKISPPGENSPREILADYWIVEARAPIVGDVTGQVGDRRDGETSFISPAFLGYPIDSVGRLYATAANVEAGEVVMTGEHIRDRPTDPQVSVEPSRVVFAPGCGGLDEQTIVISHPMRDDEDAADRQVDLGVCDITITGRETDQSKFQWDGPEPAFTVEPGRSQQITVSTSANPGEAFAATLDIETEAGRETVELETADDSGAVYVPATKDVVGEQVNRSSCLPHLNMARATIALTNRSQSPVGICSTPRIRNATGGSWGVSGLSEDDIVESGNTESVTVTFEVSKANLGEEETAELVIETSSGMHVVDLMGRVDENEDLPAAWYGGSGSEICAEDFDPAILNEVMESLLEIIYDEGPVIDIPPAQPHPDPGPPLYMLELQLFSVPLDTQIRLFQGTGDQLAMFESVATNPNLPVPLSGAADVQVKIEMFETDQPMSVEGRVWQFTSGVTSVEHDYIGAVAGHGTTLVATTSEGIATFAVGPEGVLEPLTHHGLDFEPTGITTIGDRFLVSGPGEYQVFSVVGDEVRVAGGCDAHIDTVVGGLIHDDQPMVFAICDDELSVLSVTEPGEPRTLAKKELALSSVTNGFAGGSQLALYDNEGVAVYDIADPVSLETLGRIELSGVESIINIGQRTFAVDTDRSVTILESVEDKLRQIGDIQLPETSPKELPSGSPAIVNGHGFAPLAEGDGLAVFGVNQVTWEETQREQQRKYGLDPQDVTDDLIEAVASIGDTVDDVLEKTLGVDLTEDQGDSLKRL